VKKEPTAGTTAASVLVLAMLVPALLPAAQPDQPIETLVLRETFGVSHPDQVVDFDLAKPAAPGQCHVLGPDEAEVPFQLLDGGKKLAVRTDLPAGDERTWKLMPGPSALGPDKQAVTVTTHEGLLEIANSLIAIRVPAGLAGPIDPKAVPAPLQGARYRDGTWSGLGPNRLWIRGRVKQMQVSFIEKGPLKAVVQVKYVVDRPAYAYGKDTYKEAGEGSYSSTMELQAGQPSVLIEEDGDVEAAYSLGLYAGLAPDQARYRGHHATTVQRGHEANGRAFEERQHILRVKGTGGFTMFVLPHRKGTSCDWKAQLDGEALVVAAGADVTRIAPSSWSARGAGQTVLAALDAKAASAEGMSMEGGPGEVMVRKDRVQIVLHGPAGVRKIKLPGTWAAVTPTGQRVSITKEAEIWNVDLRSAGEPVTVELSPTARPPTAAPLAR
jgi:hypothetical protein